MSDNYHQAVNGGTGANHIMLGTGDAIWFSDANGHPAVPPNYGVNPNDPTVPLAGNPSSLSEIENPNPQPGTNNFYIEDGYGGGSGVPAPVQITAVDPTAIVPIRRSQASGQSWIISGHCRAGSIRVANLGTTTC